MLEIADNGIGLPKESINKLYDPFFGPLQPDRGVDLAVVEVECGDLGVFEFSPEEGTAAAELPDAVPDDVKAARAEALMLAQQEIALQANRRMVGRPIEVLVDGVDISGRCVGRHRGQAPDIDSACFLTEPRKAGRFVSGKVSGFDGYDLIVGIDNRRSTIDNQYS